MSCTPVSADSLLSLFGATLVVTVVPPNNSSNLSICACVGGRKFDETECSQHESGACAVCAATAGSADFGVFQLQDAWIREGSFHAGVDGATAALNKPPCSLSPAEAFVVGTFQCFPTSGPAAAVEGAFPRTFPCSPPPSDRTFASDVRRT